MHDPEPPCCSQARCRGRCRRRPAHAVLALLALALHLACANPQPTTDASDVAALLDLRALALSGNKTIASWVPGRDPCGVPTCGLLTGLSAGTAAAAADADAADATPNGSTGGASAGTRFGGGSSSTGSLGGNRVWPSQCAWEYIACHQWRVVSIVLSCSRTQLCRPGASRPLLSGGGALLTGTLPDSVAGMSALQRLDLGGNALGPGLPEGLARLADLEWLDMRSNQLSSALPPSWAALTSLRFIFLGGNQLTGELPEAWAALQRLEQLDLSDNSLEGAVPNAWGRMLALQRLALDNNCGLCGPLPDELADREPPLRLSTSGTALGQMERCPSRACRTSYATLINNMLIAVTASMLTLVVVCLLPRHLSLARGLRGEHGGHSHALGGHPGHALDIPEFEAVYTPDASCHPGAAGSAEAQEPAASTVGTAAVFAGANDAGSPLMRAWMWLSRRSRIDMGQQQQQPLPFPAWHINTVELAGAPPPPAGHAARSTTVVAFTATGSGAAASAAGRGVAAAGHGLGGGRSSSSSGSWNGSSKPASTQLANGSNLPAPVVVVMPDEELVLGSDDTPAVGAGSMSTGAGRGSSRSWNLGRGAGDSSGSCISPAYWQPQQHPAQPEGAPSSGARGGSTRTRASARHSSQDTLQPDNTRAQQSTSHNEGANC